LCEGVLASGQVLSALEGEFESLGSLLLLACAPDEGGGKYKYMHEHVKQISHSFALSVHSQDRCSLLPAA
jgi:hypothetical protein